MTTAAAESELRQVSDLYFACVPASATNRQREHAHWESVPGAKQVRPDKCKGLDLFIHRPLSYTGHSAAGWVVSEARTGMSIGKGRTRADALTAALVILELHGNDELAEAFASVLKTNGLSPRYVAA